jgi:general secretion pathway protein D
LIALLDVAGYQESLVVLPIRNAAAKDIAKLIEQIISEGTSSSSRFGNSARPSTAYSPSPRPVSPTGGSSRGANGRAGGVSISKIIADDRTNSLIVKANAAGINEIKVLVNRLDTKVASSMEGAGRIHVVRLQFADAEQLAKTLSAITGSGSSRSSTTNRPSFFSPYGAESSGTVFQGDIKVSADKSTQSLVVTASPQDYVTMKRVNFFICLNYNTIPTKNLFS